MRSAIRSISITKSVDRRKGEMAGDNPYLEDWERIRHIAASISEREERVRELRGQAYELESRITDLSYEPDDDGNDRNESARSYYYDRLYGIQSEISYTEGLISSARDEAHGMAGNFRQQAGEYGQRAAHTSNAGSGFQSLEGFRFGASSARAGAALAGQRTAHYEDHAAALNELASAAEQAVEGYFAGAGSSAVRERGEYRRQGPDISGGGDGRSKESAYPGEAEEKRGGSGRNIAADAGLARLGAKGDSDSNSGVNFSKISHADVYMVDNNVEGNITASQADAILAGKWEMPQEEIREYRDENNLVWVKDKDEARLVSRSIAEEYNKKKILKESKAKLEGKKYYYDDKGILYRVEDDLMPNSDYTLNGYIYRTDEQGRIISAKGRLHMRDRNRRLSINDSIDAIGKGDEKKDDERGHLIADLFDGSSDMGNLIVQNKIVNRVDYRNYEKELAKLVNDEKEVRVKIVPVYEEASRRPVAFIVIDIIDGICRGERIFSNEEKEEKT